MKFTTHNQAVIETNGTHFQGYIEVSYADLVEIFGQPFGGDNYKVDAEWAVCFSDGTRATIYNYKNGKNYCGEDGLAVEDITEWHVGGYGTDAMQMIELVLESYFA